MFGVAWGRRIQSVKTRTDDLLTDQTSSSLKAPSRRYKSLHSNFSISRRSLQMLCSTIGNGASIHRALQVRQFWICQFPGDVPAASPRLEACSSGQAVLTAVVKMTARMAPRVPAMALG